MFPQRLQAAIALGVAARVVEVEFLAQEIGQLGPVDELAAVIQQPGDIRNARRLRQSPLDLVLCKHAASMRQAGIFVQHYLRVMGRASRLLGVTRKLASQNRTDWAFGGEKAIRNSYVITASVPLPKAGSSIFDA